MVYLVISVIVCRPLSYIFDTRAVRGHCCALWRTVGTPQCVKPTNKEPERIFIDKDTPLVAGLGKIQNPELRGENTPM